jgi:GT2 family glycosyltransferase
MTAALTHHTPRAAGAPCDVSILIVNWNAADYLLRCVEALYAHPPSAGFEVIVADNASTDGSVARLAAQFPQVVRVASDINMGFARANNQAGAVAGGRYWLLLNPDTLVPAGAIDQLVAYLQAHPRVGAVGPRLLNPDGTLQPSVERLPTLVREGWRLFHLDRLFPVSQYPWQRTAVLIPRPVEVINGACLLVRKADLPPPGLFDEDYFVYSEEIDLCDRLRQAGRELHWVPQVTVTHFGGRSTHQAADAMFLELYRNKVLFFRKRRGQLAAVVYKLVLLLAAGTRFVMGQAARWLPLPQRGHWLNLTRLYGRLLAALPRL